jgi:hypothetical protein
VAAFFRRVVGRSMNAGMRSFMAHSLAGFDLRVAGYGQHRNAPHAN